MLKSDFVRELEAELELDADARGASAAWLDFATQLGCNALGVFAAFKVCDSLDTNTANNNTTNTANNNTKNANNNTTNN